MLERPEPGQVRVVPKIGDDVELLHLADNCEAAELWLAKAGYSRARLEDVTADDRATFHHPSTRTARLRQETGSLAF